MDQIKIFYFDNIKKKKKMITNSVSIIFPYLAVEFDNSYHLIVPWYYFHQNIKPLSFYILSIKYR